MKPEDDSEGEQGRRVRVAVPIPLPEPLTYRLPPDLAWTRAGSRVRVPLGRRRLVGLLLGDAEAPPPPGVSLRDVEEVLDLEPVLPPELLELAAFVADYYLAPIGEVARALLPGDLPPWGDRRIALTDGGALSPPRDDLERRIVEVLLEEGWISLSALLRRLPDPALPRAIESLSRRQRIRERAAASGPSSRWETAVEPAAAPLEELLEACGRSEKGRAVVELLGALGRPATIEELADQVGCRPPVVQRLVRLGVLRSFQQPVRLDLDRHRLPDRAASQLVLRPDQLEALRALEEGLAARSYRGILLEGMTGSGKTEVYLRGVETCLASGRSAILLVPEIALVPALARSARRRFGDDLAILHSGLSPAERSQEWERIRGGGARVVLGPRSAVFAPLEDLGLIVVDEEHDTAYKQGTTPRYQGRDLALLRARGHGAVAVLVSATPSLESRHNVRTGKLRSLTLTERVGAGRLPEGVLVDLRREGGPRKPGEVVLSETLRTEIEGALEAGDQVVLLRNRRGYAPMLLCRACGEDFRCPDCGLPTTLHRREGTLRCHHCGRRWPGPGVCTSCDEDALEPIGAGTERIEERFRELYPDTPVAVLDADTARRPGGAATVLERFGSGEARVLIGTQMVAKGHHFPRVALAGVLAADTYLAFPDFRAVEKTYSLLTQLAGRAGRGQRPGRFVIQTWHPEHYAIRAVLEADDAAFAEQELEFRRTFSYPPFSRLVQVVARDRNRERAEAAIGDLARALRSHPRAREARITGPAPAALERLRGRWRFQLLLRSASAQLNREILRSGLGPVGERHGQVDLVVDVDPQDLL